MVCVLRRSTSNSDLPSMSFYARNVLLVSLYDPNSDRKSKRCLSCNAFAFFFPCPQADLDANNALSFDEWIRLLALNYSALLQPKGGKEAGA